MRTLTSASAQPAPGTPRDRTRGWLLGACLLLALVAFAPWVLQPDRVLMTFDSGTVLPWLERFGPDTTRLSYNVDHLRYVLPRKALLHDALHAGELPLWDPHAFLGTPFLAQWQSQVLYPPNVLLSWFDARLALGRDVALHMLIAGLGTLLALGAAGLSPGARLLGALIFAFGGHVIFRMGHPSFVATIAWLPWLLWSVERHLATRRARFLVSAGLVWSMLVLAGMATLVVWSGYLVATWIAVRCWQRRAPRAGLALALALAAGTALAAPQLVPTLQLGLRSQRWERDVDALIRRSIPPERAVQFLAPEAVGAVGPEFDARGPRIVDRGRTLFSNAASGYVSLTALSLAVLGVAAGAWGRRRVLLAGFATLAALISFGTPLVTWIYLALPGFRFSNLTRAAVIWAFCVAWLAARGADAVARDRVPRGTRVAVTVALIVLSIGVGAWSLSVGGEGPGRAARWALTFGGLGAVAIASARPLVKRRLWWPAIVGLVVTELWLVTAPYRISRPLERVAPWTPELELAAGDARTAVLSPERNPELPPRGVLSLFGIRQVGGMSPIHDARLDRVLERIGWDRSTPWSVGEIGELGTLRTAAFAMLDVGTILAPRGVRIPGAEPLAEGGLVAWPNERRLGAAWVVPRVTCVEGFDQALAGLLRPGFDPAVEAVAECSAQDPPLAEPGAGGRVVGTSRSGGRVRVEVELDAAGWLVLSESWARGWRVRVDGGPPRASVATNGILQGVALPAGRHRVDFTYAPPGWGAAWGLALIGALLLTSTAAPPIRRALCGAGA